MPGSTMREVAIPAFEDLQWLGAFARRLAKDGDEADDLIQETLMTAWQRPPEDAQGLRPWLATVLRNRWRMRRRSATRREQRDTAYGASTDDSVAPDVAVDRIRVLRVLTTELSRLDPEDQQLIVRRFLEGQSAAEIARALSVPAGTIRSRISRLLVRLRERLDERCDGRGAWCAAVLAVPLVGPAGSAADATTGGTSTMIKTTALLTITAAAGAMLWAGTDRTPARESVSVAAEARPCPPAQSQKETPKVHPPQSEQQQRWRETRDELEVALKKTPPSDEASPGTRTRLAYGRLIIACLRDIEDQPAEFSVQLTEVGAPDIGTIVTEVEVLGTSVSNPDVVECAEESMYAYVGDAPDVPFERTFRFGMRVGAAKPKPEHDGKVFRYNMTKRIDDLRPCSDGDARGFVELKVELPEGAPSPKAVSVVSTDVDDDVAQCFRETVAGWNHFATIAAETRTHRYVLPLPE